jgi:hypothetical protein
MRHDKIGMCGAYLVAQKLLKYGDTKLGHNVYDQHSKQRNATHRVDRIDPPFGWQRGFTECDRI